MDLLTKVSFPGIDTVPWLTIEGDWKKSETRTAQVARMIAQVLADLPGHVREISSPRVRELLPDKVSKKPWENAQNLLVLAPPDGWMKYRRSWVRTDEEDEG